MKSVMLSIKPKHCGLIVSGKKRIEVRKTRPKIETPFKCFIYECLGKRLYNDYFDYEGCGKVIGEFVCDGIILMADSGVFFASITDYDVTSCYLNYRELHKYGNGKNLYGWHISDLVIYDKPKELSEFMVIDKDMLKECPYRIRVYNNPDYTNGALLKGTYVCNNSFEPDFCRGQCGIATKPLTRPPQSYCYVMEVKE